MRQGVGEAEGLSEWSSPKGPLESYEEGEERKGTSNYMVQLHQSHYDSANSGTS